MGGSVFEVFMENAQCNMKCAYCFGDYKENKNCHGSVPQLNVDVWNERLKEFELCEKGKVFIWGGEPLANKNRFKEVVGYLKNRFPQLQLMTVCNGSLLTDEWSEYFIENNINTSISHDGYAQHHRGKDFIYDPEICKAIKKLNDKNLFRGFHVVLHRYSSNVFMQINYWKNARDRLGFSPTVQCAILRNTTEASERFSFTPESEAELHQLYRYAVTEYLLNNNSPEVKYSFGKDWIIKDIKKAVSMIIGGNNRNPIPTCGALERLTLGVSGKEYLCHAEGERISAFPEMESTTLENYKQMLKCKNCFLWSICGGICTALTDEFRVKNCGLVKRHFMNIIDTVSDISTRLGVVITEGSVNNE